MNAKKRDPEKERARCREKQRKYRMKYPDRVKASKSLQKSKPDYQAKSLAQKRRWLEKNGHQFWTEEDRAAHLNTIRGEYLAKETPSQRMARMAGTQTPSARAAAKAAMPKGPNAPTALFWSLISPNGVTYKFKNLAAFVRDNRRLFTEEQLRPVNKHGRTRIEAAIAMLSPRRKHCVEHCCGWRWHVDGRHHETLLSVLPLPNTELRNASQ
jgi:hypothetical protein